MGWPANKILGPFREWWYGGAQATDRKRVYIGAGLTLTDDPGNDGQTLAGDPGSVLLGATVPSTIAAASAAGASAAASRADHVHAHGAVTTCTANTLPVRDASGIELHTRTAIGAAIGTAAVQCDNSTASTGGATKQYSPPIVLSGTGWNGLGSIASSFAIQCRPQGDTTEIHFLSKVGGGSYTDRFWIGSDGSANISGPLVHTGSSAAVFGALGAGQQTVTGSRGGNAALASLLTALAAYGWIVDSTSA